MCSGALLERRPISGRSFATDVYSGAPLAIGFGLPKHLVGDWGGVSLPQQEVAEQIREGVALRPTEVAMRFFAGDVAHVEQDGGDGVRDSRAFGAQHLVAVDLDAPHLEHLLELRRIANVDLQEQDRYVLRDVVVLALLFLLRGVLLGVVHPSLASVGEDVDLLAFARFFDEALGGFVEVYTLRPEFGSAPEPRGERGDDDRPDEEQGDLYAIGSVEDVRPGGVKEHEGNQPEADRAQP